MLRCGFDAEDSQCLIDMDSANGFMIINPENVLLPLLTYCQTTTSAVLKGRDNRRY